MATRSSAVIGLSEAFVQESLDSWDLNKPLIPVYLAGPIGENQKEEWRALCYFLRYRTGGFMLVAPFLEEVVTHLAALGEREDVTPGTKEVEVRVETARGRYLGVLPVLLVDLGWPMVRHLRKVQAVRVSGGWATLKITYENVIARPVSRAAFEASELCVLEHEEGDPFMEYVTADEMVPDFPDRPYGSGPGAPEDEDLVRQLQARIVDLESQAAAARASVPVQASGARTSRELFPNEQAGALDAGTMEKLKGLAGPSPARLGRLETAQRLGAQAKAAPTPTPTLEADLRAGAIEDEEADDIAAGLTDPLQRLVALQVKQTNALMSRLAPKVSNDPLVNMLSGSGSESANNGGGGVKGCAARDAFVRQMEDNNMVGRLVLQNAQRELGLTDSAVHPGIMRDYVEKKIPLGDMKLLTFMATYLSHAWETAYLARDELMMGYLARGLLFVEQAALDSGKTSMAWLMTGLPEPNWSVTSANRRRQGLQPFARLGQASWAAANVSYLRDLDFMETKMRAVGGSRASRSFDETEDTEKPDKPPRRPWPGKPKKNAKKESGPEVSQGQWDGQPAVNLWAGLLELRVA